MYTLDLRNIRGSQIRIAWGPVRVTILAPYFLRDTITERLESRDVQGRVPPNVLESFFPFVDEQSDSSR